MYAPTTVMSIQCVSNDYCDSGDCCASMVTGVTVVINVTDSDCCDSGDWCDTTIVINVTVVTTVAVTILLTQSGLCCECMKHKAQVLIAYVIKKWCVISVGACTKSLFQSTHSEQFGLTLYVVKSTCSLVECT